MKAVSYRTEWPGRLWSSILTLLGVAGRSLGIGRKNGKNNRIRVLEERLRLMELSAVKLKQVNQILRRLTGIDGLTGIANRRRFEEVQTSEWSRACRAGTALSLIMIDVDFFKGYNDIYGHQRGDACLILLASIFNDALHRPADLVARYGGEEFMVLLPETNAEGAAELAEVIRSRVAAAQIRHGNSPIDEVVTISLGVVTIYPTAGLSLAGMITAVDEALYRAKQEGRNRVIVADPVLFDRRQAEPQAVPTLR
jgi:diguanylate cyclase (GGDEF)-like protein